MGLFEEGLVPEPGELESSGNGYVARVVNEFMAGDEAQRAAGIKVPTSYFGKNKDNEIRDARTIVANINVYAVKNKLDVGAQRSGDDFVLIKNMVHKTKPRNTGKGRSAKAPA